MSAPEAGATLLSALAHVAAAPTSEGVAERACAAVLAATGWQSAVFVLALPTEVVFGAAGLAPEVVASLREDALRYGPVERAVNRAHVLEDYRLAPGVDIAFVPCERRRGLWEPRVRAPAGEGPVGERWEPDDELVLLPHDAEGRSLGTLALAGPPDGRRPRAEHAARLGAPLAFIAAVGALLRSRTEAFEGAREQARRVLDHVQELTRIPDVGTLLDRVAENCARLAGYGVAVLTAHMEDGPKVGSYNLPPDERQAFVESSRRSTVESTAGKRARIRALAYPGTGIAYVPHDVPLSRSKAFTPGRAHAGGTWHPEDRLFLLLRTTQGRDIGVLSLDEPLDGRAPSLGTLGPLRVAESFLDLAGALLETRLLQAQVERTQRLQAVGSLVSGVAHDFNNLLAAIMGYASLLRVQLPPGSELISTARALEEACERAAGATRRLRALTQSAPAERRRIDPAQLVADAVRMARDTFGTSYTVDSEVDAGLPEVLGDPGQLGRALLNLVLNARDAMPAGGRVVVRARAEGAGGGVRLEVEDQGPGLSPEARQHLFEPFFTTKPRGKGTGLGLFAAWSAARGHGGQLDAVERPGPGALFALRLPPAGPFDGGPSGSDAAAPQAARVLVVEDERPIQELLARGIEMLGHQVEVVGDGQDAIDLLERRAGDFDLMFVDLVLPRRSGAEVYRALSTLRRDLPVVLCSGNIEEALLDDGLRLGVVATLPKPWTLPQLHEVVQRALATRAGAVP
jgi:signal transduction histidine kinase/ActR/RegA family two-component response regulator